MQVKRLDDSSNKLYVAVLGTGDVFPAKLIEFAKEEKLEGAFFNAIGAFSRVTLAYFDLTTKKYEHIEVNEQVEVASLIGNIGVFEGGPKLHAHSVVGRRDATAVAGHLVEAAVRPTLEIFVHSFATRITREIDDETGLPLIRFPAEEKDA